MGVITYTVIACLLITGCASQTWNYANGGNDWDFDGCNTTEGFQLVQAPYPVNQSNVDWDWSLYNFVFLPSYKATVATQNITGYTYTMYGDFGKIYMSDMYPLAGAMKQLSLQTYKIKFKYPAENVFNNIRPDIELQIYHTNDYQESQNCKEDVGVSIYFNISSTGNDFFNFLSDPNNTQIDLSTLIKKETPFYEYISAYIATDTQPPCAYMCWYQVQQVLTIS